MGRVCGVKGGRCGVKGGRCGVKGGWCNGTWVRVEVVGVAYFGN